MATYIKTEIGCPTLYFTENCTIVTPCRWGQYTGDLSHDNIDVALMIIENVGLNSHCNITDFSNIVAVT